MTALDDRVAALQLPQGALDHFVRHGAGEENGQIRVAQLVFQAAHRLDENLGPTAVGLTQIHIAALHTLVAAQNDNAHRCSFLIMASRPTNMRRGDGWLISIA